MLHEGPVDSPEKAVRAAIVQATGRVKAMPRKPVVAVMGERIADMPGDLVVFCDDGTVWSHSPKGWVALDPIPGSAADPNAPKPQRPEGWVG